MLYFPIEFWSSLSYPIRSFLVYSYCMYVYWWLWVFYQRRIIKFILFSLHFYCEFIFWKIWHVALTFIYKQYIKTKLIVNRRLIFILKWIWIRFLILKFKKTVIFWSKKGADTTGSSAISSSGHTGYTIGQNPNARYLLQQKCQADNSLHIIHPCRNARPIHTG